LSVNNSLFNFFSTAFREDNRRELTIGGQTINELIVNRKIYVPTDGTFARFLEVIENPTTSPILASVSIASNFGSDGGTQIISTSSGDTILDAADTSIVTDDSGNGGGIDILETLDGDPTLIHMWGNADSNVLADAATIFRDNLTIQYTNISVPANSRIIVMHVASQNFNQLGAAANLGELETLPEVLIAGMSLEEREEVINFTLAPDTDGDGLSDLREALLGTDPALPDSDSDGLLDGFEVANGLNPLVTDDATTDSDGDGLNLLPRVQTQIVQIPTEMA